MAKKAKRPSWFKMWLQHKTLIDAVPDDVVGKALKATMCYFETGEVPDLDVLTGAVFAVLKPNVDEAIGDFLRSVDSGRSGGNKRWSNGGENIDTPPIPPLDPQLGSIQKREDRGEKKEDRGKMCEKIEGEARTADEPQKHTQFIPPSVDDVREYCDSKGYSTIDPERFVAYYNARQWMAGQTAITNWKAAVDTWNRKDAENGKTRSEQVWPVIGTTV